MALTASQYRTMRDLFRGALSVDSANPSDSDVLSFFKQMLADAVGVAALSSSRQFLASEIARRILSGNFSNASDANVVDFWTQLTVDANAGSAMSNASAQYITMRKALVGAFSCDFFNPTTLDILSYFTTYAAATPLSILGSQPAWMVDGSAGTLVDAGGGVASAWNDSSGNSRNFSAAGAARPSIIASGLNSKTTCRFSTANFMTANYLSPTPGTQASYFFGIIKLVTLNVSSRLLTMGGGGVSAFYASAANQYNDFNGAGVPSTGLVSAGTWYRFECQRSNSGTDYIQFAGTATPTVGNAGNAVADSSNITLNADLAGTNAGNAEYAELFQWLGIPTAPQRAALAAYSLAKWGV
jgi:hypothetical protein